MSTAIIADTFVLVDAYEYVNDAELGPCVHGRWQGNNGHRITFTAELGIVEVDA